MCVIPWLSFQQLIWIKRYLCLALLIRFLVKGLQAKDQLKEAMSFEA